MDWKRLLPLARSEQVGSAFGHGTNWFIKLTATGSKQFVGMLPLGNAVAYGTLPPTVEGRGIPASHRAFRTEAKASVPILPPLVANPSPARSDAVGTAVGSPVMPCTMRRPS